MKLQKRSLPSIIAAVLVAVIAGVHLQQYIDFMSEIPTVGVLFLINSAGGAGLVVALISKDRTLQLLASIGSLGLAVASLISIIIALSSSLFGYSEPSLRFAILLAIIAEAVAIPVLLVVAGQALTALRGQASQRPPHAA